MWSSNCLALLVGTLIRVSNPVELVPDDPFFFDLANDIAQTIYDGAPGTLSVPRPILSRTRSSSSPVRHRVFLVEEHYDLSKVAPSLKEPKILLNRRVQVEKNYLESEQLDWISSLNSWWAPRVSSSRAARSGKKFVRIQNSPFLKKLIFGVYEKGALHLVSMTRNSPTTVQETWPTGWSLFYEGNVRFEDKLLRTYPWMPNAREIGTDTSLHTKLGKKAANLLAYSYFDELFYNPHTSSRPDEGVVLGRITFHEVFDTSKETPGSRVIGYVVEVPVSRCSEVDSVCLSTEISTRWEGARYFAYFNEHMERIPVLDSALKRMRPEGGTRARTYEETVSIWSNRGNSGEVWTAEKTTQIPIPLNSRPGPQKTSGQLRLFGDADWEN